MKPDSGQSALNSAFIDSIRELCGVLDKSGRANELRAIGFVTTDDLVGFGAFLLFDGDLPEDAERYQKLSPVEWRFSEQRSFSAVNQVLDTALTKQESDEEFSARIRCVFETCADVVEALELRRRYPNLEFITLAGTDPSQELVDAEEEFVRRLNTCETWQAWREELG